MVKQAPYQIPRVPFPEKVAFLFDPHPYKVLYGGRSCTKSWDYARALIIKGAKKVERILCVREVMKSIKDSVHQLLVDQIKNLKMEDFYRITDTSIRGANGTTFAFTGLQDHTADSIRSYEGITIVWAEEAENIKHRSWTVLLPTIRTPGREIWVTFNPAFSTSATYKRWVTNPPSGAVVVKMNYRDNPWFSDESEAERSYDEANMEEGEYKNVWEGEPYNAMPGAIYAKQVMDAYSESRVTLVPYDPRLKVHVVQDLGFTNANAVGFFQRRMSEIRCINAFQVKGARTAQVAAKVKLLPYNFGAVWLPHDGFSESRHGLNDAGVYRKHGFVVRRVPEVSTEVGIRSLMGEFPSIYFHRPLTVDLLESMKVYKRGESRDGVIGAPIHDNLGHCDNADMMRYMSLCASQFYNERNDVLPNMGEQMRTDQFLGTLGI